MKLFTEEQVKQMLIKTDKFTPLHIDHLMNEITPIELPTNDELWLMSEQHALQCGLENIFDEDGITIIKHHWAQGYKKAVNDFLTYTGNK